MLRIPVDRLLWLDNIYWADGFVVFLNGLVAAMLCPLVLDNRARNDGDANNPPELHLID